MKLIMELISGLVTSTGFATSAGGSYSGDGNTYVYMAIRRTNKPPTSGTQVYNAIARTGTGATANITGVGFAPDLVLNNQRTTGNGTYWNDRLRGGLPFLTSATTAAENTSFTAVTYGMDGMTVGADNIVNRNAEPMLHSFFKRAPEVFDVVCYTGNNSVSTIYHNLAVVPELIIIKCRNATHEWPVWYKDFWSPQQILNLNTTAAKSNDNWLNGSLPSTTSFQLDSTSSVNATQTYVAYLFATKAGVSKVGSYTGNGSTQTLDMGFSGGARFFMVKRTDSTGDWFVFDNTRGIIAADDPHLSLNTTAAEVTNDDSVDPDASGIKVNELAATHINVTSATYIYLAFA